MNKFLILENTCGPFLCMYKFGLCLAEVFNKNCKILPFEEAAQWKFTADFTINLFKYVSDTFLP